MVRASSVRGSFPRPLRAAVLFAGVAPLAAAGLAGCGGSDEPATATAPPAATQALPPSHRGHGTRPSLDRVPQRATGAADRTARRVAEAWFARVRRGDDAGAAALMRDGTRFVNGRIAILTDRASRVAAAASLPCGATPVDVGGARGGYVVLRLRLTEKAGAGRCDGAGGAVAVAIHVDRGAGPPRIDDWVRLPDAASAPPPGTPV